ncbi:MAG: hypothetical protein V1784_07125 [bacterium]
MGRWYAMPLVFTLTAWMSILTNVFAQPFEKAVTTITNKGDAMAVRAVETGRPGMLPSKGFAGQNGRSIECPADGLPHEILNIDLADEIGHEFALILYPPPAIPGIGTSTSIYALIDFSDGGVAFPNPRPYPLHLAGGVPIANLALVGVGVDWGQGGVIPIPAGRIRISAIVTPFLPANTPIRLAASISHDSHPRTTPVTITQMIITSTPGMLGPFVIPPMAAKLRVETTEFATRSFRLEILSLAGGVVAERVIPAGTTMAEPIIVPTNGWTWRVTNLGLANINIFNAIWDLSL